MCVIEEIAATIDASGMTIREIAKRAYLNDRTIYKIKAQEQQPKPEHICAIARVINEPTPIRTMCYEVCAIGQKLGFKPLNNINKSLISTLNKSWEECREFMEVLQNMIQIILNWEYKKPKNEEPYFYGFQELLDIMHCGQEIIDASIRIWGFERITGEFQKHHEKCIREGYIKQKDALSGAK